MKFTNPDACRWFSGKLRALLDMGVDCFKTDFGERIPTDVVYHDGSDPAKMHNYYSYLYNQTVSDLLRETRGEGDAVLFARSGTAGSQQFPVHWGVTALPASSPWRRACAAGCRSAYPVLAFGATTLAVLKAPRLLRSTSARSPSACCPPIAASTAALLTVCPGFTTMKP